MRLYQVLFVLGLASLSSQRLTKLRQQQIIKDVKDLQKALRARDAPPAPPPLRSLQRKARKRDEIVRLLDELENEIRSRNRDNYQRDDDDYTQELQERDERDDDERDDDEQRDDDDATDAADAGASSGRDDYKVLQEYLRCSCGSARDSSGTLRCRRCYDSHGGALDVGDASPERPRRQKPRKQPPSQDDNLLSTLSKYGSRYKLNDDLEAIVIDVANVDKLTQKNKKARAKKRNSLQNRNQGGKGRAAKISKNIIDVIESLTKAAEKRRP